MEKYSIKSVAFGGFDKQDVIQYIEKSAQEAAAVQKQLQEENDALREQLSAAKKELAELQAQMGQLQEALYQERVTRENLEVLKPLEDEVLALRAENEALRPNAEAYVQFKEDLGTIECEARKRAADLEEATSAQLRKTVDLFRAQYQVLMSTFESTAAHVNSELRRVEVNLSQLPRAMDQSGNELNELAAVLEKM